MYVYIELIHYSGSALIDGAKARYAVVEVGFLEFVVGLSNVPRLIRNDKATETTAFGATKTPHTQETDKLLWKHSPMKRFSVFNGARGTIKDSRKIDVDVATLRRRAFQVRVLVKQEPLCFLCVLVNSPWATVVRTVAKRAVDTPGSIKGYVVARNDLASAYL
jgi:hypothetical protein